MEVDEVAEVNSYEWFEEQWRALERCGRVLAERHKRYCGREVLKCWLGEAATDELIAEVWSLMSEGCRCPALGGVTFGGWDLLPPPERKPRRHREMLRALTQVMLGGGRRAVDCEALDRAYSAVFGRAMDVAKKGGKKVP